MQCSRCPADLTDLYADVNILYFALDTEGKEYLIQRDRAFSYHVCLDCADDIIKEVNRAAAPTSTTERAPTALTTAALEPPNGGTSIETSVDEVSSNPPPSGSEPSDSTKLPDEGDGV
jgi:hypothetical protein